MRAISCTCTCGSPEWKSNIQVFEALQCNTFVKGGTRCEDT